MPGCGCVRYCSQLNGVVSRAMELCGCRTGGMYVYVALPVAERMLCAAAPYAHASRHSAANVSAPRRAVVILSMVFPLYARILAHVSRARVVQPACRGVRTAVLTSLRCGGSLQITLSTGRTELSNTLTRPLGLKASAPVHAVVPATAADPTPALARVPAPAVGSPSQAA